MRLRILPFLCLLVLSSCAERPTTGRRTPHQQPTHANRDGGARARVSRPAPARPSSPPVINSDDVPAGPAQGYVRGRRVTITVVRVDDKPVEAVTAEAYLRMQAAAAHERRPVRLEIVSGFRTMAHQRALYADYRAGRGNLAARPGRSNHQSGHALDLNTSAPGVYHWLKRNAHRFGFRRTIPSEPWHWECWPP